MLELCKAGTRNAEFAFEDIAAFKMIDNSNNAIVIALDEEAVRLTDQLNYVENKRSILRKMQRYSVQVYPNQFSELRCWLEETCPSIFVLKNREMYSDDTGLKCQSPEGQGFIV